MARANTSLPVPVSPEINTVSWQAATRLTKRTTLRNELDLPIRFSLVKSSTPTSFCMPIF